jgi:hypothetical protein
VDEIISAMPTNSWKMLSDTPMKNACPQPYNYWLCSAVISAWSGGAYDAARDKMVIYGGGHADSFYNNVFAFDLASMSWSRLTEMGGGATSEQAGAGWDDIRAESCVFYPKGPMTLPDTVLNANGYIRYDACFSEPVLSQLDLQQPRSSHTYGGVFIDARGRYCSIGETYFRIAQAGSPVSICLDPTTRIWSRIADRPARVGARGQTAVAAGGQVWSVAGEGGYIGRYDPVANTWARYGYNNYDAYGGTDIDRKRNHLYVLHRDGNGIYSVRRWNLNDATSLTAQQTYSVVPTIGTTPSADLGPNPGFVYVDSKDMFYAWGGGQDIYRFNPATSEWSRINGGGDNPGAQSQWGTFGRWRYSPTRGVFVLVNNVKQNVFLYKP